jgi:glycosyltransferase involved in cell wall biosynthesis
VKISAIVPVYNPGGNIDECIESLLGQSLPSDEYEVIFVDDGSTDETPARLDALAAAHPNVRVEHIAPSGWPGKPRNVGISMARGEFVYFVDNDDWVGAEALERLYEMARTEDADVLVGKVVGRGKFVPRRLFAKNRTEEGLDWPPLLTLLSPHKLFRRSLLDQHGVRFPEGRRRLEDHVFTMHAYFHARRISVLADYPCYYWVLRPSGGDNASYQAFDPEQYYANLREVLDLVVEHTSPGELRDRLLAHWYRGKMLGRVGGTWFVNREPDVRAAFHREVHALAEERFGSWVDRWLPANLLVRSELLRRHTLDALATLAEWEADLRADATIGVAVVRPDGSFAMPYSVRLLGPRDQPLRFVRRAGRALWVPPEELQGALPDAVLDMTEALGDATAQLTIRLQNDGAEFLLPGAVGLEESECDDGSWTPVMRGEALVQPGGAAAGALLHPGRWRVLGTMAVCGFSAVGRARSERSLAEYALEIDARGAVVGHGTEGVSSAVKGRLARRLPRMARAFRRAQRRRRAAATP